MADIGRPPKFKTPEEMQKAIDKFFDDCDNRIKQIITKRGDLIDTVVPAPYTMSGLAMALGMSRQALVTYSHKDTFLDTIRAARSRCEKDIENRLMETTNQTGAIFVLKNNFGWRDQLDLEHSGNGDKAAVQVSFVDSGGDDVPEDDDE